MKDSISRNLLRQAAIKCGYKVSEPGEDEYFLEITNDSGKIVRFRGTLSDKSSAIGSLIARRKDLTPGALQRLGIKTPPFTVYEPDAAADFLREHQEIVVKPIDAAQSRGISVGVRDDESLNKAVEHALRFSPRQKVILQKQISGKLYRILTVNGRFVAAAERRAAEVVGDGQGTVEQLIYRLNEDPRRGTDSASPLKQVKLEDARSYLGHEALDAVPPTGKKVRVSALDSVSAGGEARDVTDELHPKHQEIAERLSRELDLYVCGFDIMTEDIAAQPEESYWPLLEINSGPGLKLHYFPTAGGKPRPVADDIMRDLFN